MTEVEFLHERLRLLQEQYHKDVEPIVKRLAQIRSLEMPPIYLDAYQYKTISQQQLRECGMNTYQVDYTQMMANVTPARGDMHLWTMRDEIASKVISGLLTFCETNKGAALEAYKVADAMMKARGGAE